MPGRRRYGFAARAAAASRRRGAGGSRGGGGRGAGGSLGDNRGSGALGLASRGAGARRRAVVVPYRVRGAGKTFRTGGNVTAENASQLSIAIVGPTASGKTGFAVEVAEAIGGEILCM